MRDVSDERTAKRTTGPARLREFFPVAAAGAVAGLLAAFTSLTVAELTAAGVREEARPVNAVGGAVIDRTPAPVKDWAIATFGTHDKLVLQLGILALLGLFAIVVGVSAMRFRRAGALAVLGFGLFGALVAAGRPEGAGADAVPSLTGAVAGAAVLYVLAGTGLRMFPDRPGPGERAGRRGRAEPPGSGAARTLGGMERRRFVVAATTVTAASAGAGLLGHRLNAAGRARAAASRAALGLPAPSSPAGAIPAGAGLDVPGLEPLITPNRDFYRIDTALSVPRVDVDDWRLTVRGLGVTRPLELSFAELLERELIERRITLTCVSNPVGGRYTGNAHWIGVRLADLLAEAGVRPPSRGGPADQLIARSVEGMTLGSPVETVLDGRDALLAVGMNGEPLPFAHGFPVRMVVPGLYGYVSACKWLTELELTTFDGYDAYWVERGWAARAPIKTQSRIDTPRGLAELSAGPVAVAGVAWAQHTGIDRVEVRVDDGPWTPAELAEEDSVDVWRQWVWTWDATPGRHTLQVRATDRSGETQTADRVGTVPDGATGRHAVVVTVS
ncbi:MULTISPECIES: molybdopterin-dependent oxidoreductase [Streptomyces]|uniref:DMSO/TMAO reductase YedYZ, molybdopterin-dependent catalytic subunit n=2 Tax=Streptomyces TaxID=1883 RepID=A0A1I6PG94_9ACTN|nr:MULTISPECIES: molybdopterin-dependent oxidoreductase [Streptomyces]SFS39075.1 DMSO/TMAO reductase YedYZ, molybdopterin-dependent catalytic subunit [Streptomyces harbinensis]